MQLSIFKHFVLSLVLLASLAVWPMAPAQARDFLTYESLQFEGMPDWFSKSEVQRALKRAYTRAESFMEWSLRKTKVTYLADAGAFSRVHSYGATVVAISFKQQNRIYMGPKVDASNFEGVIGHELIHLIIGQKYKDSIPLWLEEGLANVVSGRATVHYPGLLGKKLPKVEEMGHPFKGTDPQLHYQVSTALMEMLKKSCDFSQLLQMSVGKKLDRYLNGVCGITDLNQDLKRWIEIKAKAHQKQ